MISRKLKLQILKSFYLDTTLRNINTTCPFGKNKYDINEQKSDNTEPCSELCGLFPNLGDVRAGCPCQILGSINALQQLEILLKKERIL